MSYCVYYKESFSLYCVTAVPIENEELDYIELSQELMSDFLSSKKHLIDYVVSPDYTKQKQGRLVSRQELYQTWAKKEDTLFLLPYGKESDFTITQDTNLKQCSVSISQIGLLTLSNKSIRRILLAACSECNPFQPKWLQEINVAENSTFSYTGSDNIRFYTKRYLENYAHNII